ncbi:uncharacterized protein SPAPADRAFT_48149 [Spathaspora passalidarum NRRL Y-27907]|uniref:Uncharacterized protein n=1 Tax=Spathaspora passalidarum (strain NRRL Y-27907 / 11-Y1) TaxID=619300 RepID=G3AFW4_SPAPN|nr:uncharacterized protein SPAPADRAFT_48149 [Spathaspora passalidarum NRRL Y-27907]EGW35104.1 hypothetical protein SPAPADRAFT_48149 [Spathaspora passalidarum NRRL Y-27907]
MHLIFLIILMVTSISIAIPIKKLPSPLPVVKPVCIEDANGVTHCFSKPKENPSDKSGIVFDAEKREEDQCYLGKDGKIHCSPEGDGIVFVKRGEEDQCYLDKDGKIHCSPEGDGIVFDAEKREEDQCYLGKDGKIHCSPEGDGIAFDAEERDKLCIKDDKGVEHCMGDLDGQRPSSRTEENCIYFKQSGKIICLGPYRKRPEIAP